MGDELLVLLRGMEQFARNEVVAMARREGCTSILGSFIPTAKNSMVKEHYAKLGFAPAGVDGNQTFWSLQVSDAVSPLPTYIQRENENE